MHNDKRLVTFKVLVKITIFKFDTYMKTYINKLKIFRQIWAVNEVYLTDYT